MSELYVAFRVDEANYVLPASRILQMESFSGATRVPGAPEHVAGLVQLRGKVVPVVDLRSLFGLPPIERGLDARIVVVQQGSRQVGLLVDAAREVIKIDPAAFVPPPDIVALQSRRFVSAVAQLEARLFMLIDCDRVIGEEDLNAPAQPHVD
jgi:purine-binding chemotaxis protein CheW